MDSPVFNTIKNVAGYGIGTLAALDTIKSGGLGPYLMNRQRLMSDPSFRASLAGSPFAAGVFGVSGETGPAPAAPGALPATGAPGGVAQPADMVGPPPPGVQVAAPGPAAPGQLPAPSALNVPGYIPGQPRTWMPLFSPYDPEEALKQQALASQQVAIGAGNPLQAGIAKMQAGIMPTEQETTAVLGQAAKIQKDAGIGSTVGVKLPGMTVQIGSPYNFSAVGSDEYPSYQVAAAAAAARNANIPAGNPQWQVVPSGRGTFLLSQPATPQQVAPAHPPAPAPAPAGPAPAAQPSQPPAPAAQPNVVSSPPPPPPPAPAAPPRPPSVLLPPSVTAGLPAPAPSYAGGPWDLNAPAPGARIGYPSPAFDDTGAPVAAAPVVAVPELLARPPEPPAPPAPPAAPVAPARPASAALDPQAFVQGMINRGWSPAEAQAAAGNVHVESAFYPANVNKTGGDSGLVQWTGARKVGLVNYANATGRSWADPEVQMDWLQMERSGQSTQFGGSDERGGFRRAFGQGGTPADMAGGFAQFVERPANLSATIDQRRTMAGLYAGGAPSAVQPAVASPSMFARIFAPASAEAAEIPPGAVVAQPQTRGAGAAPSPDIVPPGLPTPPARVAPPLPPPPPGPAPAPVEPETKGTANVPLSRVTVRGTDGVEYSYDYGSPSDFAADMASAGIKTGLDNATAAQLQRLKELQDQRYKERLVTDADVQRFMRPQTEAEKEADNQLGFYRRAVDNLYQDFPNPSDRDTYIGWLNRPAFELVQLVHDNPRFARFVNDLAPFNNFNDIKRSLPVFLQNALGPYVPTGGERHASDFEQHLFDFRSELDEQQLLRNAANRMPAGQVTPQWMDAQRERFRNERMQNATSEELDAMGFTPPGLRPPPTVQVTPPPPQAPITYYGHSVAQ